MRIRIEPFVRGFEIYVKYNFLSANKINIKIILKQNCLKKLFFVRSA